MLQMYAKFSKCPRHRPTFFILLAKKRGGCVIISDKVQFSNLHSYEKQLRPFRHPDHFGENGTLLCVLFVLFVLFFGTNSTDSTGNILKKNNFPKLKFFFAQQQFW